MKKIFLLGILSALTFSSCKENDISDDPAYTLIGNWYLSKSKIISGADNSTVEKDATDCTKQSFYRFESDNMVYVSIFELATSSNSCGLTVNYQKNYTYDNVNKILIIGALDKYKVLKATTSELQIYTEGLDSDYDGTLDKTTYTFTK